MQLAQSRSQARELEALTKYVRRLERRLDLFQNKLDRKSAATPATGTLAANTEIRMTELETEFMRLTGEVERLSHSVGQAIQNLDKLAADVDYRLRALEQGGAPVASAIGDELSEGDGMPPIAAAPAATSGVQVSGLDQGGRQPGILGTISTRDLAAVKRSSKLPVSGGEDSAVAPAGEIVAALPVGNPKEQYDAAFKFLVQQDFVRAEGAFRAFARQHGDHALAGNAQYWLGETFYVRRVYDRAASTFLGVVERYPDSPKAADSILKLGMSLNALEQKEQACATFAELISLYPAASQNTLKRAKKEQVRLSCN